MNPDWEDIRVFVAVIRAGSLSQAVRSTGLSQPTLSRRLKSLEDSIGGSLFERLPNQMVPTKLGEQLASFGFAMEVSAESLQRTAGTARKCQRQPVRISATMSISLFLARHLESLSAQALVHDCEIDIEPSRLLLNLAYHQADIAIRLRQVPEDGLMRVRKIGSVAFTMYRAAHADPVRAACVIALSGNRPPPHPAWVDAYAARLGLPVVARLGEFFQRHEAIAAGLGQSLLPCFIGDIDPRLIRCCDPPDELSEDAYLLLHNQAAGSIGAKAIAEEIAGLFRAKAGLLAGQTVQPPA